MITCLAIWTVVTETLNPIRCVYVEVKEEAHLSEYANTTNVYTPKLILFQGPTQGNQTYPDACRHIPDRPL